MKKLYLLMMAVVFTITANAGTRNLLKMDFESGDPASLGWKSANLATGMSISGDEYGNYFQFSLGGNNGRSCYNTWGSELYTDRLDDGTYHIEFEWAYASLATNQFGTEISIFSGEKPAGNNKTLNAEANTLFSITESADNHNLFFINGDASNTFAVEAGAWFAVLLDVNVNTRTIEWRIVDQLTRQDTKASGTRTFAEGTDMLASGLNIYNARYQSIVQLDNLLVQVFTSYDIANEPTVALTGVYDTERTYSITFQEGETLVVKGTDGKEIEVEYSDTEGGVYKYVTTTSGTLEAWTWCGRATSEKVTVNVDCSIIQLPQATVAITNAAAGYGKEYTISVSNEEVPTKPTLYVAYQYKDASGKVVAEADEKFSGEKVSVEDKGTLTVTVTALGFEKSVVSVENNVEYTVKHDIDLQHMTGEELIEKGFEKMDDLNSTGTSGETSWTGRKYLYYQIATGETDEDGKPTYTNYVVYGPNGDVEGAVEGAESIQRYRFLQSKLNEETAHSLFAPLYTWYGTTGVSPKAYYEEDGVTPLVDPAGNPGGTTNLQVKLGIGIVFSGQVNDAENYNPNSISYSPILINYTTFGVDGLTDNEFIIVSKIDNYGNDSYHPQFAVGTDPATARAEYKAAHLGGISEVYKGTETFQLYRVQTALNRVLVLTPKGGADGIETLNYNKVVSDHNAPIYNLNGVQVNPNALQKGIYIKQGKKFIVK